MLAELEVRRAGRPWLTLAAELSISRAYLSDIINGNRAPGAKVLAALGLTRTVVHETSYQKIEITENS